MDNFGGYAGFDLGAVGPEEIVEAPVENLEVQEEQQQPQQEYDLWSIPEQFQSDSEKAQFYERRFSEIRENYGRLSPQEYEQRILEQKSTEISDIQFIYNALQKDPKMFFAQYIPEALAQFGVSPVLSEEEMASRIDNDMKREFGEDYTRKFNSSDLLNPRSISSSIWRRQNELYSTYENMNAKNSQVLTEWNQRVSQGQIQQGRPETIPHEEVQAYIDKNYEPFKEYGIEREEYDNFLAEVNQREVSVMDLYRGVYFDEFINSAYQKGLEEGKKGLYSELQTKGNATQYRTSGTPSPQRQEAPQHGFDEQQIKALFNGGIPWY